MQQPYPKTDDSLDNPQAETELGWMMNFILGVRRIRGEMDIKPGKPLPVLLQDASEQDLAYLEHNRIYLQKLARLESINCLQNSETAPESAIALVGNLKLLIPMAGLIDKEAELARLDKEIQRIQNDLPRVERKLSNPAFVDKAPADVIEKVRQDLSDKQATLTNLLSQRKNISLL
jgi:valyl-tRNA synthetase